MITAQNLLAHEWIGLRVTVKKSPDPGVTEVAGYVRNESRNTLTIEHNSRKLRVSKPHSIFVVRLPSGEETTVDGARMMYRPEDRVKRGLTSW